MLHSCIAIPTVNFYFHSVDLFFPGVTLPADHMYAPRPHPLLDGKHVIYYNNDNKTDLFVKLDYYRRNPKKARVVAINGYLHAMKYHRAACLLDYVMRSVEIKLAKRAAAGSGTTDPTSDTDTAALVAEGSAAVDKGGSTPAAYTDTGFDMHAIARNFDKFYKEASKVDKQNKRLVQEDFQVSLLSDRAA